MVYHKQEGRRKSVCWVGGGWAAGVVEEQSRV